jgi:hypothetical protein
MPMHHPAHALLYQQQQQQMQQQQLQQQMSAPLGMNFPRGPVGFIPQQQQQQQQQQHQIPLDPRLQPFAAQLHGGEYHPDRAGYDGTAIVGSGSSRGGDGSAFSTDGSDGGYQQQRSRRPFARGGGGGGGRGFDASSSAAPANLARSETTLHVYRLPTELCTITALSAHFERFGTIKNVQVLPEREKAFVQVLRLNSVYWTLAVL